MNHYHHRKKALTIKGEDIFDPDCSDEDIEPAACTSDRTRQTTKLCIEDEFLMVLMKLRLGLLYEDLAARFEVTKSAVQRIFYSWIQLM